MMESVRPSNIKYCLPLVAETFSQLSEIFYENHERFHYFEIWIDYLPDVDLPKVASITDDFPNRIIIVSRRLGLDAVTREAARTVDFFTTISATRCYVDFDIQNQISLLEAAQSLISSERLLLSMHDYSATPPLDVLETIVAEMERFNPWCRKFATYCHSLSDAARLFDFQVALLKQNRKHIVLGMGREGAATRIVSSLWGNEMIFAPLNRNEATAPGQLVYEDLNQVFSVISRAFGEDDGRQ